MVGAMTLVFCWIGANTIVEEQIVALKNLGIQLKSRRLLGTRNVRFIDANLTKSIVITEAFEGFVQ